MSTTVGADREAPIARRRRGAAMVGVDLGPLRRHRDFRLLLTARGVSFFGTMMTSVAVPYQVYEMTGSSLLVGALGVVQLVALLGLAFVGGAVADAADRRSVVLVAESLLAVGAGLLVVNASLSEPQLWAVFALAGTMAGLAAVQRPALEALIPRLVDRAELPAASALSSLEGTVAMVAGPALAGVLLATAGLASTYAIDAGTFVVSIVALAAMRASPPAEGGTPASLAAVIDGLRYAIKRQELLGTYLVDFVAMFFGMPMALFPAVADRYGGPGVLGLLYAAPSFGAFAATITSRWTARVHRHGRAIGLAAGAWGAAIVLFGLAPWLPLALAALAFAGGADMVSGMFRMTMWNAAVPDALRGRLAAIEMVSYSGGPLLGNAEAGLAAALVGVRASIVSGGVLCVVAVALVAAALPAFRRYSGR